VADGQLLTTEEAAWVFRRAAELEARAPGVPEALLDARTLEAAGVEAGLSPVSIRAALTELRAGGMAGPEPAPEGPSSRRSLVRTRAVPGPPPRVAWALDEMARRNLLVVRRRRGATTVWDRRSDVGATCARAFSGRRARVLNAVARLSATLGPVPGAPELVRVELRAELAPTRRLLPLRTRLAVGTGLAVGAGVVLAQVQAGFDPGDLLLVGAGAGGAAWAGTAGYRAGREARAALGDALAYALDQLEHGGRPDLVLV
jgi:hypothetical protein